MGLGDLAAQRAMDLRRRNDPVIEERADAFSTLQFVYTLFGLALAAYLVGDLLMRTSRLDPILSAVGANRRV